MGAGVKDGVGRAAGPGVPSDVLVWLGTGAACGLLGWCPVVAFPWSGSSPGSKCEWSLQKLKVRVGCEKKRKDDAPSGGLEQGPIRILPQFGVHRLAIAPFEIVLDEGHVDAVDLDFACTPWSRVVCPVVEQFLAYIDRGFCGECEETGGDGAGHDGVGEGDAGDVFGVEGGRGGGGAGEGDGEGGGEGGADCAGGEGERGGRVAAVLGGLVGGGGGGGGAVRLGPEMTRSISPG